MEFEALGRQSNSSRVLNSVVAKRNSLQTAHTPLTNPRQDLRCFHAISAKADEFGEGDRVDIGCFVRLCDMLSEDAS